MLVKYRISWGFPVTVTMHQLEQGTVDLADILLFYKTDELVKTEFLEIALILKTHVMAYDINIILLL